MNRDRRHIQEDTVASGKELLQSEYLKQSNVFNLLPVAVYVVDASGIIIDYNKKAVELWGRTPEKGDKDERFCGALKLYRTDGTHLPHSETPVSDCLIDGIAKKDIEVVIERPDLSKIVARVNIVPIKDDAGNIAGALNCFYDITEEKKNQKKLDRKTRELQDYVDNAAVGLHWVDNNGVIKWANKAELDLLGYTKEEYIGHHISEFHADSRKITEILNRLTRNDTLINYEATLRCKDGSLRTVHISSNVFREDGRFIHTRCFTSDITEQKKLFTALQESEARYRNLVNTLPAALYTCDKEGRITFFNDVAVHLWGYKPDINDEALKFCASYKVWMMDGTFVPPDKTPMAIALHTGQSFHNIEALVERPDGSKFYACVNIEPIFDNENNITGAINIFQDITDLKKAQLSLMESELKYRNLVEKLDVPLYTTDASGIITLYNRAAARLWGREPVIGKEMWCGSYKIFRPDGSDLPLDNCPMAVCLREHRSVTGEEIVVQRPDGSLRYVAPHPQPVFDIEGKMTGAINMLIDITDIKHTERALRESEKQYRQLNAQLEKKVEQKTAELRQKNEDLKKSEERYHKMIDEVEDYAIVLIDKDGIIQNWNKGAEKIKGYKESEIVGKSFELFYLPEDQEKGLPMQLIQTAAANGKVVHEGWRVRSDGTRFWGNIVLTALHDDENRIIGFSKVTRNLTEKKMAEDKLREYTNELEFQNKELEQFAYAASHDMKEPLRKISLYNSMVLENEADVLNDKSKEYLKRSINAAGRLSNLIRDLLTYSKTTPNTAIFEKVDLHKIMEEIALLHKDEIEQKEIKIGYAHLPVFTGIPFQIRQLMENLIDNSVKYKHPDRKLEIKITSSVVAGNTIKHFEAAQDIMYYNISVTDNGLGFDPEASEKIFEIFQRLHNLPHVRGSGIGLAICKKIVQNHKGFIKATGKINAGARFEIYLPKKLTQDS